MIRQLSPRNLLTEELMACRVECHRQLWRGSCSYEGYHRRPRPYSGLIYAVSPIHARFSPVEGEAISITQGELLYIPRGLCYRVAFSGSERADVDLYTVNFDLYDRAGNECRLGDALTRLTPAHPTRLATAAEALFSLSWAVPRNQLRVTAGFFDLLHHAIGDAPGQETAYYPLRHGLRLLREEWQQNYPMARYASACGMSESRFYLLFHRFAGMGPAEYRTRLRLDHAASLLKNSSLPISEIATRVGYQDPFYFSRIFSAAYGVSPRIYRQNE